MTIWIFFTLLMILLQDKTYHLSCCTGVVAAAAAKTVDDNKPKKKLKKKKKNEKEKPPPPRKTQEDQVDNKKLDLDRLAPFDTDIRDDCFTLLSYCQSEIFAHAFLQCPASCTAMLEESEANMKGTADDDNADGLWDSTKVPFLRTYDGKRIYTDRFEGTVTVVCILPLLPGMAVYYYEMLEYLHSVYTPNVEFVILPIDHGEGIHIQVRQKNPKVLVMEEESSIWTHPWVKHLTSIKPRSGGAEKNHRNEIVQVELHTDRVTFYIVSSDGYYIEKLISPTMANLKERITIYQKTIDYEL